MVHRTLFIYTFLQQCPRWWKWVFFVMKVESLNANKYASAVLSTMEVLFFLFFCFSLFVSLQKKEKNKKKTKGQIFIKLILRVLHWLRKNPLNLRTGGVYRTCFSFSLTSQDVGIWPWRN